MGSSALSLSPAGNSLQTPLGHLCVQLGRDPKHQRRFGGSSEGPGQDWLILVPSKLWTAVLWEQEVESLSLSRVNWQHEALGLRLEQARSCVGAGTAQQGWQGKEGAAGDPPARFLPGLCWVGH